MKTLAIILAIVFLTGCASTSGIYKCLEGPAEKLVSLVKEIPSHKWMKGIWRPHPIIFESNGFEVKVSKEGNLFVNTVYKHLPWKLKLELQEFYKQTICMIDNDFSKTTERLNKEIRK